FRNTLAEMIPFLHDRLDELTSWEQVKLLEVRVDALKKWYQPGLICIGDAAHAMSPIGGVGINLAIQDAVASANHLIPAFIKETLTESTLHAIQSRRKWPTYVTQRLQLLIQNRIINPQLDPTNTKTPFMVKCLRHFSFIKYINGYLIGIGIRPEKIIPYEHSNA